MAILEPQTFAKILFFLADSNGALVFDEERWDKYGEMDQDGEVALML